MLNFCIEYNYYKHNYNNYYLLGPNNNIFIPYNKDKWYVGNICNTKEMTTNKEFLYTKKK